MKNKTSKLTDLKLGKDEQGYYLAATYVVEDEHRIKEIHLPKVALQLVDSADVFIKEGRRLFDPVTQCADIGFGECLLRTNEAGYAYIERIVEEKTTEMTLAEIEKKLGYKVKIVSEK